MRKLLSIVYTWLDARTGVDELRGEFLNHEVRPYINWMWCFGGLTFLTFVILLVTGPFLALYYVPTPTEAYISVQTVIQDVPYGWMMRNLHKWGSNLMIVLIGLHALRVFYHGAFRPPREMTWITGALLIALVMTADFTGYLLPWDQIAYWATVVGTEMIQVLPGGMTILEILRGGTDIGAGTLNRFFIIHVFVLPVLIMAICGAHFLMIRLRGIADPL